MSSRRPKARAYHSPRRRAGKEQTRDTIVDAAVRLHARGITTLSAVAEEAGVSLPTVAKHFPTREDLFGACTRHAAETARAPSAEALAAIADPAERVERTVRETFAMHEASLGLCWTGYHLAGESTAMRDAMRDYEAGVAALADALLTGLHVDDVTRGFVRALLGALAYRGLRLDGELDADQAAASTIQALRRLLNIPS